LAVALARRLGVGGEELENVHIAALLHDVGKIALPESVLSKPGPLADDERELVQRHSIIGYELLCDLGIPLAAEFVLHHHERWDGGGYPVGKAGAEIPFGSRLILVADAFDALTSDRAYRRGVSVEAAIHEIQRESGRQFDPLIVSALHEHFAHPEASPHTAPVAELSAQLLEWSSSTSS
jgi:HD-GYP domain-containing protein (c-di-GMP phosphodiesterase class II)